MPGCRVSAGDRCSRGASPRWDGHEDRSGRTIAAPCRMAREDSHKRRKGSVPWTSPCVASIDAAGLPAGPILRVRPLVVGSVIA